MEYKPDSRNLEKIKQIEEKARNTKEELSFDDFVSRRVNGMNMYNNFPSLFYTEGMMAKIIRGQSFFQRFQTENPKLEESLTNKLSEWRRNLDSNRGIIPNDLLKDLYEAYKIILSYEEVNTNDDLFR